MKTKHTFPVVLLTAGFILTGCGQRGDQTTTVDYLFSNYIGIATGDVRVIQPPNSTLFSVSPFNTSISGRLYSVKGTWSVEQVKEMQTEFDYRFSYYSALSDRHYDYCKVTERDEEGNVVKKENISNLKVINDSYGSGEWIQVDDFLYDTLYENYQFTLETNGKFNMFVGPLNDLYEAQLKKSRLIYNAMTPLDHALSLANDCYFGPDLDDSEVQRLLKAIPHTKEEFESVISFNPETKSVKLNSYAPADAVGEKVAITLGGSAKGFAVDAVADYFESQYPGVVLLIDSGTSSIKTVGTRQDGEKWKITYANPIYRESLQEEPECNMNEVYIQLDEDFNLSTSGYYEHYFYVNDNGQYKRRCHIFDGNTGYSEDTFDQVSVYLNRAGLADMFTTALMNCVSVSDAYESFNRWTKDYNIENPGLILCYKSLDSEGKDFYHYQNSDLSNLSEDGYPTVTLSDGSTYSGKYNDIPSSEIESTVSKREVKFKEIYACNDTIYSKMTIFKEKTSPYFENPENAISLIHKIS